jgi:hypothetical protein
VSSVTIRLLTEDDAERLKPFRIRALTDGYEAFHSSPDEWDVPGRNPANASAGWQLRHHAPPGVTYVHSRVRQPKMSTPFRVQDRPQNHVEKPYATEMKKIFLQWFT